MKPLPRVSHRLNNCSSFKLLILKLGFKTGRTVRRTTFTVQNKDTAKSSQHENWWVIEVKSRFKVKIFRRTRTNKRERTGPFAWSTHATISDDCFPWKKALMQTPEALSCQITSPINKKIGCFCKAIFLFYFQKQPNPLLNGEVIWQASDFSLTKEPHVWGHIHTKAIFPH